MQREFFNILRERNEAGTTVFLSSHVLSEVQRNCARAAVIRAGRVVVAIGTADYRPTQDASYRPVFDRADRQMYRRKQVLKKLEASIASQ